MLQTHFDLSGRMLIFGCLRTFQGTSLLLLKGFC